MNYKELSEKILKAVGGTQNIDAFTNCMTRLRIHVKDTAKVDTDTIEKLTGVAGVVAGDQTQIIVGPGHAQRLREAFEQTTQMQSDAEVTDVAYDELAEQTKADIKNKQTTDIQKILKSIGNVFIPLIPGFVATGMIAAIANVLKMVSPDIAANQWFVLFATGGSLLVGVLNVLAGYNAAKEFGGSPVLGAIMGALVATPALKGLEFTIPVMHYVVKLAPNLGGVLGVIASAYVGTVIEKRLRKVIPAVFDLFVIPLLTVLAAGVFTIFVIMPIAAILMNGLIYLLIDILLNKLGVLGGYVLAASFLPMVMLGIHQAFTPIHAQLIESQGYTMLLPIMAMAGAGQVGAALAIFIKTKDAKLKETAASGLPVGLLGVGEPLIYGLSLPLFYPFITACLGAGFGGAVITLGSLLGHPVGALALGPSGILLIPLIANGQWLWYVAGLITAYLGGFILTYFFGYNDKLLERLRK